MVFPISKFLFNLPINVNLYVGLCHLIFWMRCKSNNENWQNRVNENLKHSLNSLLVKYTGNEVNHLFDLTKRV